MQIRKLTAFCVCRHYISLFCRDSFAWMAMASHSTKKGFLFKSSKQIMILDLNHNISSPCQNCSPCLSKELILTLKMLPKLPSKWWLWSKLKMEESNCCMNSSKLNELLKWPSWNPLADLCWSYSFLFFWSERTSYATPTRDELTLKTWKIICSNLLQSSGTSELHLYFYFYQDDTSWRVYEKPS